MMTATSTCPVHREVDVDTVRRLLREGARSVGLDPVAETRLITAGVELARNILRHAGRGWCRIERVGDPSGIRARFVDDGPGIANLEAALTDGFGTAGTLGLGLPGCRRLADEFDIASDAGGTVVTITVWGR